VLKTPFGEFITPNITPDRKFGIGAWRDEDFIRALRFGVSPRGEHYFPVFPYTSYSGMTDRDMLDLKAYLFSLPGVAQANQAHSVSPPFGWRFTVAFWKLLYFGPGQFQDTPGQDAQWNRGAYLVRALGHCGECHTPRNVLGATQEHRELSGTKNGPEGGKIPNLTPDRETGLGKWLGGDVVTVLEMGMLPDGDFVGSVMAEVVDHGTSHLSHEDRQAIEVYLLSRPAIKSDWRDKK
jgi:mono/diheme cytochrome c family protein